MQCLKNGGLGEDVANLRSSQVVLRVESSAAETELVLVVLRMLQVPSVNEAKLQDKEIESVWSLLPRTSLYIERLCIAISPTRHLGGV